MIQYLVLVGAAASLFGSFVYIRDTARGTTKPNRVTWLMWALAPLIATAAALSDGVRWAVVPVFMSGFGPVLVLIASLANPHAYWKLGLFDYLCGACSGLALVLWIITQEPVIAIALAIASDGFALLPTLIKSWRRPDTESGITYAVGIFSALTGLAAIQAWAFSEVAFPIYLVIANCSLIFAIYRGRIMTRAA